MRHARQILAAALILAAAPLFGGCAANANANAGASVGGSSRNTEEVSITVENDLTTPLPVTVFVVGPGARSPLGTVGASSTRGLTYRSGAITGSYRLVAQTSGGAEVISQPITLTGGESLTWNLRANTILVNR